MGLEKRKKKKRPEAGGRRQQQYVQLLIHSALQLPSHEWECQPVRPPVGCVQSKSVKLAVRSSRVDRESQYSGTLYDNRWELEDRGRVR